VPEETITMQLAREIENLKRGDAAARDRLLAAANERLTALASQMLRGFPRVHQFEETGDVAQKVALRLRQALAQVEIRDVAHFLRLAALQIRRELKELARQLARRPGWLPVAPPAAGSGGSDPAPALEQADSTNEPRRLLLWAEFHDKVDALPDRERSVFELRWYQDLQMSEIADQLGVSVPTVKRAWLTAQRRLYDLMQGEMPG
jgi:RNA polymerase sigma-70 factor (ECF subfamily)